MQPSLQTGDRHPATVSGAGSLPAINMQQSGGSLAALVCILAAAGSSTASKLADHFKVCSRSDPQLGQCIVDSLNGAREQLVKGIPELGLAPLDPMLVTDFDIDEKEAGFNLKISMKNNHWLGLGNFTAVRARVDFVNPYLELQTVFPQVVGRGPYGFDGHLLALHLSGQGDYESTLDQVNVTHRVDLREEKRGGEIYWEVTRYRFDMEMGDLKIHFNNMFDGNLRMDSFTNEFISKNWRTLYQTYRPTVTESIGAPFKNFTNALLRRVPLRDMFTD